MTQLAPSAMDQKAEPRTRIRIDFSFFAVMDAFAPPPPPAPAPSIRRVRFGSGVLFNSRLRVNHDIGPPPCFPGTTLVRHHWRIMAYDWTVMCKERAISQWRPWHPLASFVRGLLQSSSDAAHAEEWITGLNGVRTGGPTCRLSLAFLLLFCSLTSHSLLLALV